MKNIRVFLSENFQFFEVKFSIYLNRHAFIMVLSVTLATTYLIALLSFSYVIPLFPFFIPHIYAIALD